MDYSSLNLAVLAHLGPDAGAHHGAPLWGVLAVAAGLAGLLGLALRIQRGRRI